jgi:two-component system response regulator RegX3
MNNELNLPVARIAFLEDDEAFAANICKLLKANNYEVTHFSTGYACLQSLKVQKYDIGLFDWYLPDIDAPVVMSRLKTIGKLPPIIFLTSYDNEINVTQAFMDGADDYVVKLTSTAVLIARINALLRRLKNSKKTTQKEILGHIEIDYQHKIIYYQGTPVGLTGTETLLAFELLYCRGQIVSRQNLNEIIGLKEFAVDTRRLDVHLSHLRKKLGLQMENGWKLTSVYQRGYRLEYFDGINIE